MSLCTYETRNISLADMLVRALPLVSPTSETLIAARLGSCPEEQASRFVVGSLERPGPAARAPEGCHISRRAAAAAWPVHPKGRPSARRRQLVRRSRRTNEAVGRSHQPALSPGNFRSAPTTCQQTPSAAHRLLSDQICGAATSLKCARSCGRPRSRARTTA